VLANIRSLDDLWRYSVLAYVLFKHKLLRLFGLEPGAKAGGAGGPAEQTPGC